MIIVKINNSLLSYRLNKSYLDTFRVNKIHSNISELNLSNINEFNHNVHTDIKKNEHKAEITAKIQSNKVGNIKLIKHENDWYIEQYYINYRYNQYNIISNKLLNEVTKLQNEANTTDTITSIISYFEKD